jgi:monoterpene epsilon-lactone hydrolase
MDPRDLSIHRSESHANCYTARPRRDILVCRASGRPGGRHLHGWPASDSRAQQGAAAGYRGARAIRWNHGSRRRCADTVGGISGWWCLPADAEQGAAILHLHGGWFNWGTAVAYRNLVGHIAARAHTVAFVPDYRLAPENPFPAGVHDVEACYRGLVALGFRAIALSGDSAGGNLALVLLSLLASGTSSSGMVPTAAVALSPVTDLTLRGSSIQTRAAADPYFTRSQVEGLVRAYLGDADPNDPLASPLFGDLHGLPPVRVHVGDEEILLEDSRRYVARAVEAGVDAKLDVWLGMPHGFVGSVGSLAAADQSLDAVGTFLREQLRATV